MCTWHYGRSGCHIKLSVSVRTLVENRKPIARAWLGTWGDLGKAGKPWGGTGEAWGGLGRLEKANFVWFYSHYA